MYLEHFRIKKHPFRLTPDTSLFFSGGNRGAILDALIYAISTGEGVIKVVGEVGSGKTMLCRILETKLPNNIEIVYLANPGVEATEVLHAIAFELKLHIDDPARQYSLLQSIYAYLLSQYTAGRRVVVFIEEAQNMPLATLEEIRMLSNLETQNDKLLQIVLFGQPELDEKLADHSIRQLRERITHSFRLLPLSRAEVHEYITHRLAYAGCQNPHLFSKEAIRLVARASEGWLRRINILADKSLLAAFIDHSPTVHLRHAQVALRDSEFVETPKAMRTNKNTLLLFLLVFVASVSFTFFGYYVGTMGRETPLKQSAVHVDEAKPTPIRLNEQPKQESADSLPKVAQAVQGEPPKIVETNDDVPLPASPLSFIEKRIAQTDAWLDTISADTHVIQIMTVSHPSDRLLEMVKTLDRHGLLEKTQFYPVSYKGQEVLILWYGEFQNATEANKSLASFPKEIQAHRPYVRTLKQIVTARNGASR